MKKIITLVALVFCLDSNAQVITTYAGNGTQGNSGFGMQATSAELYSPYAVTFDPSGNLIITENGNNIIRKVNSSGIITTIAGNGYINATIGGGGYSGDGGQATLA